MRSTLGRYQILDELGRGGMGIVYKALDPKLDRFVAIKCMSDELSKNELKVTAFLREARHAASLSHPNVVQVFNTDESSGIPYLVMQFVDGDTLSSYLHRRGSLSQSEALRIIHQAGIALEAAFDVGILHQDVKPGNIMLDAKNHVYLTDFGIAKVANEGSDNNTIVGTPSYMAPELFRRAGSSIKSDIYSLGMVLFEILNGKPYFSSESTKDIVVKQTRADFPDFKNLNHDLNPSLLLLLRKMTAPDPALRYANYRELIIDIDSCKETLSSNPGNHADISTDSAPTSTQAITREELDLIGNIHATQTVSMPLMQRRKLWMAASLAGLIITSTLTLIKFGPDIGTEIRDLVSSQSDDSGTATTVSLATTPATTGADSTVPATSLPAHTGTLASAPGINSDSQYVPAPGYQSSPGYTDSSTSAVALLDKLRADKQKNVGTRTDSTGNAFEPAHIAASPNAKPESKPAIVQKATPAPSSPQAQTPTKTSIVAMGDDALNSSLKSSMEAELQSRGLNILDSAFIHGLNDQVAAGSLNLSQLSKSATRDGVRYLVVIESSPAGSQQLEYYGRQSTAYTTMVNMKCYDLVNLSTVTTVPAKQIMYTSLNASKQANEVVRASASSIFSRLSVASG
ncbi:MAG: protein kinase [Gammaproteobacteria bacterium]|nr:protein kinase [Gammaproteobacteria bacterium]